MSTYNRAMSTQARWYDSWMLLVVPFFVPMNCFLHHSLKYAVDVLTEWCRVRCFSVAPLLKRQLSHCPNTAASQGQRGQLLTSDFICPYPMSFQFLFQIGPVWWKYYNSKQRDVTQRFNITLPFDFWLTYVAVRWNCSSYVSGNQCLFANF